MRVLITGGAGFIGCHLARYHLEQNNEIIIFDNLSRPGASSNLRWLMEYGGGKIKLVKKDIVVDIAELAEAVQRSDVVYHMAGQVAVTSSVIDPQSDFAINTVGTFNLLEAIRLSTNQPSLFFASTNKVYGGMEDVKIVEKNGRYNYQDYPEGIPENRVLDFHSPYGCSKGAADQYVRDYARMYGLKTVVFRQSCIYGTRQFGVEDQGWIAHFIIAAQQRRPLTIYGDGKQVRDLLYIDDLIAAYAAALAQIETVQGRIYNIGGGPDNVLSLLELVTYLEKKQRGNLDYSFAAERPGDQPVFICNVDKAAQELSWAPQVRVEEGLDRLWNWVRDNPDLFREFRKN